MFFNIELFTIVISLAFLDYLLAVIYAIRVRRFSSAIGLYGLTKKLAILMLVLFVSFLKRSAGVGGVIDMIALDGLIAGIILNELVSVRRNLKRLGLDIVLMRWLPEDHEELGDQKHRATKKEVNDAGDDS